MIFNISNRTLFSIFAVLLIGVAFLIFKPRNERTFKSELVSIDTSNVTVICIYPHSKGHKEIKLYKNNNNWFVKLPNGNSEIIQQTKISEVFAQLLSIKPQKLVTKNPKMFKDLQVDTSGTLIKVYEDKELTLDIIIGRFVFQQPRTVITNVRLNNDTEVYATEGFFETIFGNIDYNFFRDKTILRYDMNGFTKLSFVYPADSSFQAKRYSDIWKVDDKELNNDKISNYLATLSNLQGIEIVDKNLINFNSMTKVVLNIETDKSIFFTITGFYNDKDFLIGSSLNTEKYFKSEDLFKRIFIGKKSLF